MRRLFWLALVAVAAWYGWHHWQELGHASGSEAVIENHGERAMLHVRIDLGSHELAARDSISVGSSTTVPFHAAQDGTFHLHWLNQGSDVDHDWTGGEVTAGPMRMRHHLQVQSDGGVVYGSDPIQLPDRH